MIAAASSPVPRLLAGPPLDGTAERWPAHLARLGELPSRRSAADVIDEIEAAGLLGRGGGAFPVARKWRAIAERRDGGAVVVANGAEGEPASWKDRVLMAHRPHLVIDGAVLAARAIGAEEIILYVGEEHEAAGTALRRALLERRDEERPPVRIEAAPEGYISGEATAAVHRLNGGDALPTMTPPRVSQAGVGGRPTLVQNVETLAHAALIARRGAAWYRAAGRGRTPGTTLVTVGGAVDAPEVREIELGLPVGELAVQARVEGDVQAVLLGGYGGAWVAADEAWELPLDPSELRARGATLGCGVVQFLSADACGVRATAALVAYLAQERAGQCGPCEFGLPAIAAAVGRVAAGASRDPQQDLRDVERWSALITGRGACHHPDGAVLLVTSALDVFGRELEVHARFRRCSLPEVQSDVA